MHGVSAISAELAAVRLPLALAKSNTALRYSRTFLAVAGLAAHSLQRGDDLGRDDLAPTGRSRGAAQWPSPARMALS